MNGDVLAHLTLKRKTAFLMNWVGERYLYHHLEHFLILAESSIIRIDSFFHLSEEAAMKLVINFAHVPNFSGVFSS